MSDLLKKLECNLYFLLLLLLLFFFFQTYCYGNVIQNILGKIHVLETEGIMTKVTYKNRLKRGSRLTPFEGINSSLCNTKIISDIV